MVTVLAVTIVTLYLLALGARPERAYQDSFESAGDEPSAMAVER